jgi:hypothetical protein
MTTDQMRAAFEAHMTDGGKWPRAAERTPSGEYLLAQTASAWRTWQAAQTIPAGWQLVPIDPTPEMLATQHKDAAKITDLKFRAQVLPWMDDNTRALWAELLAAAPKAAQSGWQPIETAPKDGREVLLRCGSRVGAAMWCTWPSRYDNDRSILEEAGEAWSVGLDGDTWDEDKAPTHWMPLPAAPKP